MLLSILTVVAFATLHDIVDVVVPSVTGFRIDGDAVKLAIEGAATTVTVTCAVAVVSAAFVAVNVYVVVADGVTLTLVPVTVPTLLSMLTLVAPVTDQLSVVVPPAVIVDEAAVKLAIEGAATTVTVTCAVAVVPAEFVAVRV
jgi:predicted RecA/RadA family phage recombinase